MNEEEKQDEVVGEVPRQPEPAEPAEPVAPAKAVKAAASDDADADDAAEPAKDTAGMAQQMHDLAVAMGAACGEKKSADIAVPLAGMWAMTTSGPVIKAFSLTERADRVRRTWSKLYRDRMGNRPPVDEVGEEMPYVRDVLDDQLIVSNRGDLFSYPYTIKQGGEIEFGDPSRVEVQYVAIGAAVSPFKSLAVKSITEYPTGVVVGGHLLLWGDPSHKDMGGDYFVKGLTELWLDRYPNAPTLFHHGLDQKLGLAVIGHRVKAATDDTGVWVESWLDKSSQYWSMVKPLLEKEALFYSPGSASHLIKRGTDGQLKSFPVIEDTLTPVPMQHRLLPVSQIKAAYQHVKTTYQAVKSELDDDELEIDDELLEELDELDDALADDDDVKKIPTEGEDGEWDWVDDDVPDGNDDDDYVDDDDDGLKNLMREADLLDAAISTAGATHRLEQLNR
ncbi:MAG: hypothetical protein FOGNACKC_00908 [Anaerolineae bacterium]|nr:hypothetical protein [Anaerolineae bacterium]